MANYYLKNMDAKSSVDTWFGTRDGELADEDFSYLNLSTFHCVVYVSNVERF